MEITGKKLLITGASSGIGAATAIAAGRLGAQVILVARSRHKLASVMTRIESQGGTACYFVADLSDPGATTDTVERIVRQQGLPDIVLNNAGAGRWKDLVATSPDEAMAMMAVPYLAAFTVTKAVLPGFLARKAGLIINLTSMASYMVWPGATAYTSARWALRGFHLSLTAELRGTGVATMIVALAKVQSDYWRNNPGSEERVPKRQSWFPELSVEQAAACILKGIRRDASQVFAPRGMGLVAALAAYFPSQVK